jgi:hypothetical protein
MRGELRQLRRHKGLTRRAPRRPRRRLACARVAPGNGLPHALQSRATLRRIEAEPTLRQATREQPINDEAIVGTRDMPGDIARLDLRTLSRIGARSPKGDAGKGTRLGANGLPRPGPEERRHGRRHPQDPATTRPLREVDHELIEGGSVHGAERSSAHQTAAVVLPLLGVHLLARSSQIRAVLVIRRKYGGLRVFLSFSP